MNIKEMLVKLEAKFGKTEDLLAPASVTMSSCSGSKCEYAIGDASCTNCYGAMNYSGMV